LNYRDGSQLVVCQFDACDLSDNPNIGRHCTGV
jgi:hypothetical protein